jgi:hypothetical protein
MGINGAQRAKKTIVKAVVRAVVRRSTFDVQVQGPRFTIPLLLSYGQLRLLTRAT